MKIYISNRAGTKKESLELSNDYTVAQLKAVFKPRMSVYRKFFKFFPEGADPKSGGVSLAKDTDKLVSYGISEGSVIQFKDLGPQIGYRTVFVLEYAGPIAIMLLYVLQPSIVYGGNKGLCPTQKLYLLLWFIHFLKREGETFFVHKFSRPTMPFRNVFKNCIYYWGFALGVGYYLCHPKYTAPTHSLDKLMPFFWTLFELSNFAVHMQLSSMRKGELDTKRDAPKGPLFSLVSCPNYTFEVLGWVAFSIGTNIMMSWVFTFAGLAQMTEWALKKHNGYIKNEPGIKKRKAIIPFVV